MSIFNDGVRTLSTRGSARAVVAVSGIFITRFLGPHDKGLYMYAAFAASIVLQFTYGACASIARQWGRKKCDVAEVYAASMVMGAATLLAALVLFLTVAAFAPSQRMLFVACAALPFMFFSQIAQGFFLTAGRASAYNMQTIVTQVSVALLSVLVLTAFGLHLRAVLIVWVCAQIAGAIYSAIALREYVPSLITFRVSRETLREHIPFAIRSGMLSLSTFANTRIDVLVTMLVLGPTALGVYSVAVALVELLWMVSKAASSAVYAAVAKSEPDEAARLTARCLRHVFLISAVIAVGLLVVTPVLVSVLYGKAFERAVLAFAILAPGAVVWSMMDVMTIYFTAQRGRPGFLMSVQCICALICGACAFAFAHVLGVLAGALGTTCAYIVGMSVAMWAFLRSSSAACEVLRFERSDMRVYARFWERATGARAARS